MSQELTMWQFLDSFFPTGGFAHSYGLEASSQLGFVTSASSLQAYVEETLENTGALLLPFVHAGHTIKGDVGAWLKLDKVLNAMLSNQVARRASSSQGSSLLRTAESVYPAVTALKTMRDHSRRQRPGVSCHHALVFGVLCGLLGFEGVSTQRAYLFVTMRDLFSAATRLNLVGPLQAAALQQVTSAFAERLLSRYANRPTTDAHQISPLLDIAQGCHEHLFSRLFCS